MNSYKIWKAMFCTQFGNINPIFLTVVIPDYNGIYIKTNKKKIPNQTLELQMYFLV